MTPLYLNHSVSLSLMGMFLFCYYMLKKRIKEIPKQDTKEFVSVSLSVFKCKMYIQ